MSVISLSIHESEVPSIKIAVQLDGRKLKISALFPSTTDDDARRYERGLLTLDYEIENFEPQFYFQRMAHEWKALNAAFDSGFQNPGVAFTTGGLADRSKLRAALVPVAELGYDLFARLFHVSSNTPDVRPIAISRRDFDSRVRKLRHWLLADEPIDIITPHHIVPWPILYPDKCDATRPLDPERFWGIGRRVQILDAAMAEAILFATEWRVAACAERGLRDGFALHRKPEHPFVRLRERVDEVQTATQFFKQSKSCDILYYYGHARGGRGYDLGAIELGGEKLDGSRLDTMLRDGDVEMTDRAPLLLFLNGCSTGVGVADTQNTLVELLATWAPKTLLVVSTLGPVPPWPAAEFARKFFCRFLLHERPDGSTTDAHGAFGRCLLDARRDMLNRYNSPIGLFYIGIGRSATHIQDTAEPRPPVDGVRRWGASDAN